MPFGETQLNDILGRLTYLENLTTAPESKRDYAITIFKSLPVANPPDAAFIALPPLQKTATVLLAKIAYSFGVTTGTGKDLIKEEKKGLEEAIATLTANVLQYPLLQRIKALVSKRIESLETLLFNLHMQSQKNNVGKIQAAHAEGEQRKEAERVRIARGKLYEELVGTIGESAARAKMSELDFRYDCLNRIYEAQMGVINKMKAQHGPKWQDRLYSIPGIEGLLYAKPEVPWAKYMAGGRKSRRNRRTRRNL